MNNITVEKSGKYAHKATFTDAFGCVRTVFTLNGEMAALKAAKNRINESNMYGQKTINISNLSKFLGKLFKRRKKNKLANKSRKSNR